MTVYRPPTIDELLDLRRLTKRAFKERHRTGQRRWERLKRTYLCGTSEDDEEGLSVSSGDGGALYDAMAHYAVAQRAFDQDVSYDQADWGSAPVGLLFHGDDHVGSLRCDYERLRHDMQEIGRWRLCHPNALHLVHLGDAYDAYRPNAGRLSAGMFEEVEPRLDRQQAAAEWVLKQAGNWDYLLNGCHLAWELREGGRDTAAALATALGAKNGGFGMEIEVSVGGCRYLVLCRHKAPGESRTNTTNAHRRLDDDLGPAGLRADVIALAHLHVNDLQVRTKAGRRVVYLRAGSYKGADTHARQIGAATHAVAQPGNPLVIFLPDRHHVLAFPGEDWRYGLALLEALRDKHRLDAAELPE